jgi:hypothetical protein
VLIELDAIRQVGGTMLQFPTAQDISFIDLKAREG